jgi:hypothetical protein
MEGERAAETWVRRAASVLSREILDEAVLLDPEGGLYFGVNPTGSLLWSAMAEAVTLSELVRLLVTRFGIPDEQAWGDVRRFVGELERHGLVEILAP